MEKKPYHMIVIGAGPIGMTVAIEAKKAGLSCLMIEKGMLVNALFHFPTNMTFFSTSKLLEIGDVPFISHADKPTRREALEYFRRVYETWGLDARFYEKVTDISKDDSGHFLAKTSKGEYLSKNVVIATGFYGLPHLMNVPGEGLQKVKHYYDEPHPYVGQEVAVIGAANSACDVALELFYKGAHVTMIIRGGSINERVKYWIKPNIENRIKEGSINAYFNSTVKEIREDALIINTPEGEISIANDFVLAMTGYEPDFTFLSSIGIEWEEDDMRKPLYDEETHESNIPGIYLAGVICGGMETNKFFIENAKDHAEKIVQAVSK